MLEMYNKIEAKGFNVKSYDFWVTAFGLQDIVYQTSIIILQIFYSKASEVIESNHARKDEKAQAYLVRDQLRSWLLYCSPYQPEFYFSTVTYSNGDSWYWLTFIYLRSLSIWKPEISVYSIEFVKFLRDPVKGRKEVEGRLNNQLDILIRSNLNYTTRLLDQPECCRNQIQLMRYELSHLMSLKRDKSSIWPENRKTYAIEKIRRQGVRLALICHIFFFCSIACMTVNKLDMSHNYRSKRGIIRTYSWMAIRSWINDTLAPMMTADTFSIEISLVMLGLIDLAFPSRSTKISVNQFLHTTMQLRQLYSSNFEMKYKDYSDEISQMKLKAKRDCGRLAMEIYIRTRYRIETLNSMQPVASSVFGVCIISIITIITTGLYLYVDMKTEEGYMLIGFVSAVLGSLNMICLSSAFHLAVSVKEFDQMRSICPNSLIELDDEDESIETCSDMQDRLIISNHMFMLWKKMTDERGFVVERGAIRVLGIFSLDYSAAIRLNILVSYILILFFTYR